LAFIVRDETPYCERPKSIRAKTVQAGPLSQAKRSAIWLGSGAGAGARAKVYCSTLRKNSTSKGGPYRGFQGWSTS